MTRISLNLFVLDCDDFVSFQWIVDELVKRRIFAWIRTSTRGGQFWLLCADGEVANGIVKTIGRVDILGNGKYSLAPPSIHPDTGEVLEWLYKDGPLPPVVRLEQLDFLPLQLEKVKKTKSRLKPQYDLTHLPLLAQTVLVDGDITGYDTNSEAEYAVVLSLLQHSYPDDSIRSLFEKYNPPHYAKKQGRGFDTYTLAKAKEYLLSRQEATEQGSTETTGTTHSSHFKAWAESVSWPGRTGNTDKAVFLALCQRMRMEQGTPFRASVREVAELAGYSKEAVHRSLTRMMESGLIRREGKLKHTGVAVYSLHLPKMKKGVKVHTVGEPYAVGKPTVCTLNINHDAWHQRALGKSSLNIYKTLLSEGPMMVGELVTATGRTRPTVKRALAKLRTHGLVRQEWDEWEAVEVTVHDLNRIALKFQTLGRADIRADKHQEEREVKASKRLLKQKVMRQQKQDRKKRRKR